MPATLNALLADPRLGLRLLTEPEPDPDALATPIRWVATSELDDPTPYLHGGELVLTTGLRLPRGVERLRGYVDRLIDAGVVGLGYGVGLVTDAVPDALIRAAGERALPLLEVDQPTPFIAIGKAVADLLAADQHAELTRGFTGQQALTRAAVTGGTRGVVNRLAAVAGCWAALLDTNGQIRHVAPAGARGAAGTVAGELGRLRGHRHVSLALVQGDTHVIVQALTPTSVRRGFLAVGVDRTPSPTDRSLINIAAALLSFDLEQSRAEQAAARSGALLRMLLGGVRPADDILAGLGGGLLTDPSPYVVALAGAPAALNALLPELVAVLGDDVLAAIVDGHLIAVTAAEQDHRALLKSIPTDGSVAAGISHGTTGPLGDAVGRAREAAAAARQLVPPVLDHDQLAGVGALGLAPPAALRAYAGSVLRPLDEYAAATGIDLVASLAAWLSHHGQYDPAAASLEVHRHTLRYRVRKAEELLGRDLSTVDGRMELWVAITARRRG